MALFLTTLLKVIGNTPERSRARSTLQDNPISAFWINCNLMMNPGTMDNRRKDASVSVGGREGGVKAAAIFVDFPCVTSS